MSRICSATVVLAYTLGWACAIAVAAPLDQDRATVGRQPDGRVVVPTNQVLHPAGLQVEFPGRPTDLALSPDGKLLAVMNNKSLVLIRVTDRAVMQTLPLPAGGNTFVGITWTADGNAVFISGADGQINRADIVNGVARWARAIALPIRDKPASVPGGLALSPDGTALLVCLNRYNSLGVVDLKTGQLAAEVPVGVAPYGVAVAGDVAYVTNWGGRHPEAGEPQAASADTMTAVNPVTGVASSGTVSVVDLAQKKELAQIAVGLHPCGLALNRSATRLFVANANSDTVSVIDTAARSVVETIAVAPVQALPFGSAPNAVALSPDERTLYVANGGNNSVAVVRLGAAAGVADAGAASRVAGFIPSGWYPGSIRVSADGGLLFVANVKGVGSLAADLARSAAARETRRARGLQPPQPGAQGEYVQHHVHEYLGSVSCIPVPDEATLAGYTQRVAECNRLAYAVAALQQAEAAQRAVPVPLRVGHRSVFEHVIYIIKENRTYDQVLGDMAQGNGDPALVHFGEEITPNHHKLARDFVLLDNFYCSGVLSADGHQWTDEAYVTDYVEKSFGGWKRGYPFWGGDPLAYAPSGFLWDNALSHSLTFRDYGEFTRSVIDPAATWADIYADYLAVSRTDPGSSVTPKVKIQATTTVDSLRPYLCPSFAGFSPFKVPDVYRVHEFVKELREFEASGKMPNLIMMLLPNDHTNGTTPGMPTPRAMVADNDLALGRVVEAVSHSKFWPTTCIFVVEDDPQSGLDHVDGHRTVAFAISPYTKRGAVDSTNYNQTGMVRTIELILGLPPMNQFDLSATPMASCFTDKPDLTPYDAVPNRIPLDEMNPPLEKISGAQRYWALTSLALPLDEVDQADEDTFNRVLWHSVKGYDTPYPRVASAPIAD